MAKFDHSEAEKIISMTDVQRAGSVMARASALKNEQSPKPSNPKPPAPKRRSQNIVVAQMKNQQFTKAFDLVFNNVREAVSAAQRACQNPSEGVQSKKEADALLERSLNDLITVVEEIRDGRKEIIRQRSPEEAAHPHLVA